MILPSIMDEMHVIFAELPGITRVYPDPPASINEFPSLIIYASRGNLVVNSSGFGTNVHQVRLQIYHSMQVFPEALDAAKVWPDRVLALLYANPTFNGSVSEIQWPVTYICQPLRYNDKTHYGVTFDIALKVNVTL